MKWSLGILAFIAVIAFALPAWSGGGVDSLSCKGTGVGLEEREAPPAGYQAKLVFANPKGEYYAGVQVLIRRGGGERRVTCNGPWLFLKGEPGTYQVLANVGRARASRTIVLPDTGMPVYYFHLK